MDEKLKKGKLPNWGDKKQPIAEKENRRCYLTDGNFAITIITNESVLTWVVWHWTAEELHPVISAAKVICIALESKSQFKSLLERV
jgi:hypothetical protein